MDNKEDPMVPFIVDIRPQKGEVIKQSGDRVSELSLKSLKSEINERVSEVFSMFQNSVGSIKDDYYVDEIGVSLGISATGKIVFVSEASAEATFSLKLKRRPDL